jgi:hypothetical protein
VRTVLTQLTLRGPRLPASIPSFSVILLELLHLHTLSLPSRFHYSSASSSLRAYTV